VRESLEEFVFRAFSALLFCLFLFLLLPLLLLLHQWEEARSFADHRSLENEMGVGIWLFFFDVATLAFTDRTCRVLEETDTGRTCICRIE